MVKSLEKVLTFFVVIILILLLLDLLGGFISSSIPEASERLREIMYNMWYGFHHIVHSGSGYGTGTP